MGRQGNITMKLLGVCQLLSTILIVQGAYSGPSRITTPPPPFDPRAFASVVVGAEAYNTSQIIKATNKFLQWSNDWFHDFNVWNTFRMNHDGMLCRTTSDCSWLDNDLYCEDYWTTY